VIDDEIAAADTDDEKPRDLRGYMSYYLQELRDHGFDVTAARGADEALDILERGHEFDLAVVDVMMPPGKSFASDEVARGMRTGLFLVERIHERWRNLSIVIISNAVPSLPDAPKDAKYQELIQHGVVRKVLFKLDVTPADLVAEISDVLSERQ
jgi:CheY-like chemotaxis protein